MQISINIVNGPKSNN